MIVAGSALVALYYEPWTACVPDNWNVLSECSHSERAYVVVVVVIVLDIWKITSQKILIEWQFGLILVDPF